MGESLGHAHYTGAEHSRSLGEVVMGITLDTTLSIDALKAKLLDGLAYCR